MPPNNSIGNSINNSTRQEISDSESFEPPKIGLVEFGLRLFAGLGAGILANLILFFLVFLANPILEPIIRGGDQLELSGLLVFVVVLTVTTTAMIANIIGTLAFTYAQSEKYQRRSTVLTHVLIANILVLAVLAPIYAFYSLGTEFGGLATIAALHILSSTLISALILELIGNTEYSLVGVYANVSAVIFAGGILNFVYTLTNYNFNLPLFMALPLIWFMLALLGGLFDALYGFLYRLSGNDFLFLGTRYGADYGLPPEEDNDPATPEYSANLNRSGSEFLHQKKPDHK